MLLTVVHDKDGNMVGAIAHPQGTPPASPPLEPGQYVADIDVPEIVEDAEPRTVFGYIAEIVEERRVKIKDGKAGLVRKKDSTDA